LGRATVVALLVCLRSKRRKVEKEIKVVAVTAEDYLRREYPAKEPLIDGLIHKRDMIAFGARRRHGKTTLLTNMAVAMAVPEADFIGYRIPERRKSLLLMLEDDPGEYQHTLRKLVGQRKMEGAIKVLTRVDFYQEDVSLDARSQSFQAVVRFNAGLHQPDLIVLDNLAQVVNADYNDATKIQDLMKFCFKLTSEFDCAVLVAAHPRKQGDNPPNIADAPELFFESIMGSSHFINSTGSLWGMERRDELGYSVFVGGRQRSEGTHGVSHIRRRDDGWFELIDEAKANLPLVLNTSVRQKAWSLLPEPTITFGYRQGEALVKPAMASGTYAAWIKDCRRLRVIVETGDRLAKAPGLSGGLYGGLG
jgi:hypothetical protein